jgi:hypothetical protein
MGSPDFLSALSTIFEVYETPDSFGQTQTFVESKQTVEVYLDQHPDFSLTNARNVIARAFAGMECVENDGRGGHTLVGCPTCSDDSVCKPCKYQVKGDWCPKHYEVMADTRPKWINS